VLIATGIATGYVLGSVIGNAYSGSTQHLPHQHGAMSALVITIVASTGMSFFFYSQRPRPAHLQAQRDAAEARLKLLEVQLEPHMLFNTLANLRVLIATDPPRAQAMLDHLIAYLRATLGASRATLHPLEDRIRAPGDDYLALMAVRMGPRLQSALDLPEALRGLPVPPLLLQPLVENAIRHGLEPQVAGGRISVRACASRARAWC
jgi:LytS/YehU family sensor histidine kinase